LGIFCENLKYNSIVYEIKQPRAAASQRLLAENVRDTAPKIAKLKHKIANYKMA